jgi:hypothetical protein
VYWANRMIEAVKPEQRPREPSSRAPRVLGRHAVNVAGTGYSSVRWFARPHGWKAHWPVIEVFSRPAHIARAPARIRGVDVPLHLAAVVSGGEDAQFAGPSGTERI